MLPIFNPDRISSAKPQRRLCICLLKQHWITHLNLYSGNESVSLENKSWSARAWRSKNTRKNLNKCKVVTRGQLILNTKHQFATPESSLPTAATVSKVSSPQDKYPNKLFNQGWGHHIGHRIKLSRFLGSFLVLSMFYSIFARTASGRGLALD